MGPGTMALRASRLATSLMPANQPYRNHGSLRKTCIEECRREAESLLVHYSNTTVILHHCASPQPIGLTCRCRQKGDLVDNHKYSSDEQLDGRHQLRQPS